MEISLERNILQTVLTVFGAPEGWTGEMPLPSLDLIPDEIIRHILLYVPPRDTLVAIQPLSHRYNELANEPLLWRYHCRISFTYWNKEHCFASRLTVPAPLVGWKKIWIERTKKTRRVSRLFEAALRSKTNQLYRIQQICLEGYDAKDYLLQQYHCDPATEDFLTRR